jgi:serine/threonine-protein kinase HipA
MDHCIVFDCRNPLAPIPVASFGLDAHGDGHLRYGQRYLQRPEAFALDPLHLPLTPETQRIPRLPDGTYGVISDAGPNAWGVKLANSILRARGEALPATAVDWLLQSWHYGAGCLGFSADPQVPPQIGVAPQPLAALSARIVGVLSELAVHPDADLDPEAIRLATPGASLGGVRPKTVVIHEGREYIAKFSRADDVFNVPLAEYATLQLAMRAGIRVPDFELIDIEGRSVLLVERFDRDADGARLHYVSARSLIDIPAVSPDRHEYVTDFSYAGIAEKMRGINPAAVADSQELFRRMVLNILVGNVDDHLRNHGMIMESPGVYRLTPVFDVVPHLQAAELPQSIGVGAHGAASTMENALSQCGRFFLERHEAVEIIREVKEVVAGWRQVFRAAGASHNDMRILAGPFAAADA